MLSLTLAFLGLAFAIGSFFFVTTRGSLLVYKHGRPSRQRHVYLIYRNPFLIRMIDRQFVSSVILLFQYHRLAKRVLAPACASRQGKRILQVSCAFGNFSRRLASCYHRLGEVFIFDIMHSEVVHTTRKLAADRTNETCRFFQGDAESMPFQAGVFDHVVSFFLFHELPMAKKKKVFEECLRVLKPGGTFVYGEFHRPGSAVAGFLSRFYFWIFEPHAREMWSWNPATDLDPRDWRATRETIMDGYFQVVSLERLR
jgi:ubiquinone/menaquinone biosynthesis C-methylase UbiE